MPNELVFTVGPGRATRAQAIDLAEAGLRERADLQEWVRAHPDILGADVRIVTFEFGGWQSREGAERDRLDLLGLDSEGRLVVAELKRGLAPDTVEMQAIKYAAFASRFTPELLAESHATYLGKVEGHVEVEDAQAVLENHIGGPLDPDLLRRPRIVLVASGFAPQVTASAVWLTEMGLDVTLVQFSAYRADHDLILTVSQLWPVPDVEDFTVAPRQAEVRAAEDRVQRRRETNAVATLIGAGTVPEGETLSLVISSLAVHVREVVGAWVAEDPRRGRAEWRNDERAPLVWELDATAWSPTGLAKHIIEQASGERRAVVPGPRVWSVPSGDTLSQLAGFGFARERDWSSLHRLLSLVRPGEWTSYGDLAEVIGSAARAVGQHVTACAVCPNAYRVLTSQGDVATEFTWADPLDRRDPREVLRREGLAFDENGRASMKQKVTVPQLRDRLALVAD